MDKKICVRCKTENESSFRYCKGCGAQLPIVEERFPFDAEVVLKNPDGFNTSRPTIDGVDEELLKVYIGKNHPRILNSFYNMSLFNQKSSFCLPVLVLGLLFGFFGISCWFFYRKINKLGFLFLALSLIAPIADFILNFDSFSTYIKELTNLFSSSYMADPEALNLELERILLDFSSSQKVFMPRIYSLIEGLVAPIVMSIFALFFYKNKAIKDIKNISNHYPQDSNLLFRLFLAGGTSGTRVLIPFAITIGFYALSFAALMIFSL